MLQIYKFFIFLLLILKISTYSLFENEVVVRGTAICYERDLRGPSYIKISLLDREVFIDHYIGSEIFYFSVYPDINFTISGKAEELSSLDPYIIYECYCGNYVKVREVRLYEHGVNRRNSLYYIKIDCSNKN
ncbi:Hypothetical protein SRAE_X000099800 [Strongyloides ratti]|uniref:Transthyretin-like family-containing protein n=1 Tax=Strongyloides ratti TaxID=34506 RepID=A0A090LPC2_STRRB|nr:Hypothetical protein SRAE_X000099800 [Strongyloides ratti]CEF71675.1 Hypothetical protein SRAE_X000099800 [Strongyloides ratti]